LELGCHKDCPEKPIDPNPTGYEYWTCLSFSDGYLTLNGEKTTGENLHPTCKNCNIRGKNFPDITRDVYMKRPFPEDY
jgi:hypothetical protein